MNNSFGKKAQTENVNDGPRNERCDSGVTLADYCHTSCGTKFTENIEQNIEECASRKVTSVKLPKQDASHDLRDCIGETSGGEMRNDTKDNDCVSQSVVPSGIQSGTSADVCDKDYEFDQSLNQISRTLKYVNFSGCCYMTDTGLR